jgi:hypothetical protein
MAGVARKLKVYRTPIGFHDAYVAAPSQKAALRAWGASRNLFASGAAELVTDDALTEEPLAHPGEVVRRTRGTEADHLAALAQSDLRTPKSRPPRPDAHSRAPAKPKPKPSRATLDAAEAALTDAEAAFASDEARLRERERALAADRRALEKKRDTALARLERARERSKAAYAHAIDAWRGER